MQVQRVSLTKQLGRNCTHSILKKLKKEENYASPVWSSKHVILFLVHSVNTQSVKFGKKYVHIFILKNSQFHMNVQCSGKVVGYRMLVRALPVIFKFLRPWRVKRKIIHFRMLYVISA